MYSEGYHIVSAGGGRWQIYMDSEGYRIGGWQTIPDLYGE